MLYFGRRFFQLLPLLLFTAELSFISSAASHAEPPPCQPCRHSQSKYFHIRCRHYDAAEMIFFAYAYYYDDAAFIFAATDKDDARH